MCSMHTDINVQTRACCQMEALSQNLEPGAGPTSSVPYMAAVFPAMDRGVLTSCPLFIIIQYRKRVLCLRFLSIDYFEGAC